MPHRAHAGAAAIPSPRITAMPSDSPEPPEPQIVSQAGSVSNPSSISDTTGITVVGRIADMCRLIAQFGVPNVMLSIFMLVFVLALYYFRTDALRTNDLVREDMRELNEKDRSQYTRTLEAIELRHTKQVADQREDHREDRRQEWLRMSELADSVNKAGARTATAIELNGKTVKDATDRLIAVQEAQTEALKSQNRAIDGLEKTLKKMPQSD